MNRLRPLEHAIAAQFVAGSIALWFSSYCAVILLLSTAFAVYLYHWLSRKEEDTERFLSGKFPKDPRL